MFKENPHRGVILWLLSGCLLVYIMVVVGCITRLTHSGLSITDWSFMGSVYPMSEEAWQKPFQEYQKSPEYQLINSGMSLEEFKSIFFWEYLHRFIGRTIGLVFILGFFWFLYKKKFKGALLKKVLLLVVLGALQGLIGWWMVKSGLVKNPAVSHYRLATHLMSAFTVFAFTFWFALELIYEGSAVPEKETLSLRKPVIIFFVALILQIIYGAFVAGLKAGQFFPTWPKMGDEWFPEEVILAHESFIQNFMENGAGVQFIHRTFAFIVCALMIWVWIRANRLPLSKTQNTAITLLVYGLTFQFMLGIFTLLYGVPVLLGVLHQSGAFFLFTASLFMLFHLRRKGTI